MAHLSLLVFDFERRLPPRQPRYLTQETAYWYHNAERNKRANGRKSGEIFDENGVTRHARRPLRDF
jgi:hypothetical protein